jgi:hypothetical protein
MTFYKINVYAKIIYYSLLIIHAVATRKLKLIDKKYSQQQTENTKLRKNEDTN